MMVKNIYLDLVIEYILQGKVKKERKPKMRQKPISLPEIINHIIKILPEILNSKVQITTLHLALESTMLSSSKSQSGLNTNKG